MRAKLSRTSRIIVSDRPLWYDRNGNPISVDEAELLLQDISARRVAWTEIGDAKISTVHLVLDHGLPDYASIADVTRPRPPMIFETAIFDANDEISDVYGRAPTEEAALAMHDQACAEVRARETRR